MVLIIGGAYQGKLDYAMEEYGLTESDVFTCEEGSTAIGFDEKIVDHFERYVLALVKAGQVPEKAVGMQIRAGRYKGRIIICDDISQGVVPMDTTERAWREGVGRTMVRVAKQADKVVRVFCGIPVVLKDDGADGEAAPKTDGLDAVFAAEANGAVKTMTEAEKKAAAAANGAVKTMTEAEREAAENKAAEDKAPAEMPHRAFGRGQSQAASPHSGNGQGSAQPRTPFGMPGATPFKNFDFGNSEDGGLTPEEQFRRNFEKMKAERKAAREKAAKEGGEKGSQGEGC